MPLSKEEKTNRIAKLRERSDYSLPAPGVVLAKGAESPVGVLPRTPHANCQWVLISLCNHDVDSLVLKF